MHLILVYWGVSKGSLGHLGIKNAGSVNKPTTVQWLAHWTHNSVIWVRFPARDLPTESVTVTLSDTSAQAPMWDMQEGSGWY